jgi:hypothetical protein
VFYKLIQYIKSFPHVYIFLKKLRSYFYLPVSVQAYKKKNKHFFRRARENFSITKMIKENINLPSSKLTFPERSKPHLLIVLYYFRGDESKKMVSTENHNLIGTIKASELATFEKFYYDLQYQKESFPRGDLKLIEKCLDVKPDMIILSSYSHLSLSQPRIKTLEYVGNTLGIPISPIWWDAVSPRYWEYAVQPLEAFSHIQIYPASYEKNGNYLNLWVPQDPLIFNDPDLERTIPVSFIGSTVSYRSIRLSYLESLKSEGIDLLTGGGTEEPLTVDEYAKVFKMSKISLNFSFSVYEIHQIKGRIFEVMLCGALLLESENSEIKRFYTPYKDYVPFYDKDDLLEKIKYYLLHEKERKQIAESGKRKTTEVYNHTAFWSEVLDSLP